MMMWSGTVWKTSSHSGGPTSGFISTGISKNQNENHREHAQAIALWRPPAIHRLAQRRALNQDM
jgi:hypothetical protein